MDETNDTLSKMLAQVVRLGGSAQTSARDIPSWRDIPEVEARPIDPFSLRVHIVQPDLRATSTADQILSILFNSYFRRGSLEQVEAYRSYFEGKISDYIVHNLPIEIVLPTLPFKDQNPLTTRHSVNAIDLGEYLLLAQLKDLAYSVASIYRPGLQVYLIADGQVYEQFFAPGKGKQIINYRQRCQKLLAVFDLMTEVEITDMVRLVKHNSKHASVHEQVFRRLQQAAEHDSLIRTQLMQLQRGMLVNQVVDGYGFADYRCFAQSPVEKWPTEVKQSTWSSAIGYAAFLISSHLSEVVHLAFPRAIRATVHPKDAPQLPLHLVNRHSAVFPYNGVPLVNQRKWEQLKDLRKATRIVRFYEALRYQDLMAVYQSGGNEPFYYRYNGR